jgi:hypothetical protein
VGGMETTTLPTLNLKKGDKIERHLDGYGLVTWEVNKINRTTYRVHSNPRPGSYFNYYLSKATGQLHK